MIEWKLIHEFKCSRNSSVEFDLYDTKGVLSFEAMRDDEFVEIFLSKEDECVLRDLLNKRNKGK